MFRMKDDGFSLQWNVRICIYPWKRIVAPSINLVANLNRGVSKRDDLQTPSPKLAESLLSQLKYVQLRSWRRAYSLLRMRNGVVGPPLAARMASHHRRGMAHFLRNKITSNVLKCLAQHWVERLSCRANARARVSGYRKCSNERDTLHQII